MKEDKAYIGDEIVEGNRAIAKFMGDVTDDSKEWIETDKRLIGEYKYHCDWSWLMPVVEKINDMCNARGRELSNHSRDQEHLENPLDNPSHWKSWSYYYVHLSTDINQVWDDVVKFITWYNNAQTKKQ